jgi:hypothetical protein
MTQTTDGRMMVWAVFDADRYECVNFVGVFELEADARLAAERIEGLNKRFYAEHMESEWRGRVEVRCLVLGEYELPPDCRFALEPAERCT